MSRLFFPLRTCVEFFPNSSSLDAVSRAKEGSVLFDELVFEAGAFDIAITDEGSFALWIPPNQITDDHRERAKNPVPPGTEVQWSFGVQSARGLAAQKQQLVTRAPLTRSFVAEFHTEIIDELGSLGLDWIAVDAFPTKFPRGEPLGDYIANANLSALNDRKLLASEENSFMRSFLYESFNRDAAIAWSLDASINVSPLFMPVASHFGEFELQRDGTAALRIVVPHIGSLPWDAVAEFRSHPGAEDARARLREFECLAAAQSSSDAFDFLSKVSGEIVRGYQLALEDERKKWPEEMGKQAAAFAVSFIPAVGPMLATGGSGLSAAVDAIKSRRTWTAALMTLAEA